MTSTSGIKSSFSTLLAGVSVEKLEKLDVDYTRETVKLRDAVSKNKQPMLLSFKQFPTMREILLRREEKLRPDCKFIFHRNGRQIKDFREEWSKATARAKLAGLSVHDLCRSCAVNLSRAGVEKTTASKYMNRKSLAIYKQYRIVHSRDTERAGAALVALKNLRFFLCSSLRQSSPRNRKTHTVMMPRSRLVEPEMLEINGLPPVPEWWNGRRAGLKIRWG